MLGRRRQPSNDADERFAYRIQSVNYPKTYLCNSHGNWSVNNQAITWVREPHLTRTTLWYIVDHNVWKAQKEQLYRPDSAISIHGSSRHVSATARGRSDVQLELQRTEFRDDTLPDPEPPSTPVEEKLAEEEQFSDTKDSMPVEIEHQLTDIEKVVTGLVEAKERNVADGGRWFLAREAKAEADTSVKAPQQSSSEGGRERPSDAEEEAARKSLGDQTQAAERERLQGEHPGITPDIDKAQEQAERGSPSAGGIPGVEPSQEGLLVVEPSENAESLTPKPEPIATEPESLRTKVSVEYRSGQKAGIPHPAQVGTLEQGIGAPKLEDAEIGAPDVNPPLRIDPQRDGIGAPSPSLPRTLESAFERPFGFFDLGDRNGGRPALRPIVMQTGFSHLKRL